MDEELLYSGNENLLLFFDDDGEELRPGDRVLVNHEFVTIIAEIGGQRSLTDWSNDQIVESVELITDAEEWPDEL